MTPSTSSPVDTDYRVLARKYRPNTFDELIGQEAMVRTLSNAVRSGRLAHAFIMTGVRGTGKTTTARLIARALNCIGEDGDGGPTITPCGICEHCRAIAEDRHMDVLEMDAASRTGVDNVREIIESVAYRPTSARYKVYIIDEVHMLSKGAFNALLKTLEEPPQHVKFIFATTEIRRVPVTVLSRCQRFDLRRVDQKTLKGHFAKIAENEGATVTDAALALIARAADGSVRDGLSLLDQAIAHGAKDVDEARMRQMLGLADRAATLDLLAAVLGGRIEDAINGLGACYQAGEDLVLLLSDMLELTHWLTRLKVVGEAVEDGTVAPEERARGADMAARLPMATLARSWQMLLKGLEETRTAPMPLQAAEMVLIRLAYTADLPSPEEAVRRLEEGKTTAPSADQKQPPPPANGATKSEAPGPAARIPEAPPQDSQIPPLAAPRSFRDLVDLAAERREALLHAELVDGVHLVDFEVGRLRIGLAEKTSTDLPKRLKKFLDTATGQSWQVILSDEQGDPTLRQQSDAEAVRWEAQMSADPLVKKALSVFPDAKITNIRKTASSG